MRRTRDWHAPEALTTLLTLPTESRKLPLARPPGPRIFLLKESEFLGKMSEFLPGSDEQERILADARNSIKRHAFSMRKAIDEENLREALRFSAAMLGELRTSQLSPQKYYELYMLAFDQLVNLEAREHLDRCLITSLILCSLLNPSPGLLRRRNQGKRQALRGTL